MNFVQQVPSIFGAKIFFGRRRRNCFGLRLWVCEMLICFWNLSMHVSLKCCKAFKIFLVREITLKILFAFPFHLTKQRIHTVFKAILVLALAIWGLDCWGNFLSFFFNYFYLFYFYFISFLSWVSPVSFCHLHIPTEAIFHVIFSKIFRSPVADCSFYYIRHSIMSEISISCKSTLNFYD